MAGGVVEGAAAGYQAQGGEVGRAVDGFRRESGFGVLADARDAEHGRDPVGELHVDGVAPVQGAEAEEDGGALLAVDVPLDDRRADLAGRRRVLVPRRLAGVRPDGGHLDRAVGVEPEVQQRGIHADGRDMHRHRERACQRRPAGRGAGDSRLGRRGLRRVHLGADRDAHGGGAGHDEQDPGDSRPSGRAGPPGWWAAARTPSAARRRPRGTRQYAATAPPAMSPSFPPLFYSVSLIFRW